MTTQSNAAEPQQWTGTFESVPLGAEEKVERLVDGRTIDLFAEAVQSFHPVHMSREWVKQHTNFPDRIAHGLLTSALMSRAIVNFCERYEVKTVLVSSSAKYVRPVFAGDTITTSLKLVEKIEAKKRLRCAVTSVNQRGEVVMAGEVVEQAI
jgi:3-hydroxybutyryl-CoA dehydratase